MNDLSGTHTYYYYSHYFSTRERIIEYCLEESSTGKLAQSRVDQFIRNVAARTPAPGGGSVAATVAALVRFSCFTHSYSPNRRVGWVLAQTPLRGV